MRRKLQPGFATNPFRFDPSQRIPFEHPEPGKLHKPEDLPEEFRSASPPPVGPDALCFATKDDRPMNELELLRPFLPGLIQLCFLVPDRKGPWLPSFQVGYELMWVEVTTSEGEWPNTTYHGELWNVPVFIGPETLQIGSAVTFQMLHVTRNFNVEAVPVADCSFITIEEDSKPWLTVRSATRKPAYPITEEGVRKAGRDLYDSGQRDWVYSSDVDFPKEHGCHLDIRELLEGAFVARAEECGDTRFSGAELGLAGAMKRACNEIIEKGQVSRLANSPSIIPDELNPDAKE